MSYRVTLTACTAGNPLQAWFGTTGDGDDEHVPNDVWEDFDLTFADLDAAKDFIRKLHPDTSTHILLYGADADDERCIYHQDYGDDLDAASLDVVPDSQKPPVADDVAVMPEAPPLFVAPK